MARGERQVARQQQNSPILVEDFKTIYIQQSNPSFLGEILVK
jgi:hypothetical protein